MKVDIWIIIILYNEYGELYERVRLEFAYTIRASIRNFLGS